MKRSDIPIFLDKRYFYFYIDPIDEILVATVKFKPMDRKIDVKLEVTPLVLDFIHSQIHKSMHGDNWDSSIVICDKFGNIISTIKYKDCSIYDVEYEWSHFHDNSEMFVNFTIMYEASDYVKGNRDEI